MGFHGGAGGAAPTGPAGGDLTGTFPNPTVANSKITVAKMSSGAAANGLLATADGAGGVAWVAAGSAVASVFGRTGAVVAAAGDYTGVAVGGTADAVATGAVTNAMVNSGAAIALSKLAAPASGKVKLTGGDITTTSVTFVDLTGATITFTTGARRVLCVLSGVWNQTLSGRANYLDLAVDGTLQGGTLGLFETTFALNSDMGVSLAFVTDVLTAASHTFKIQWRTSTGTGTFYASATSPITFAAVELLS